MSLWILLGLTLLNSFASQSPVFNGCSNTINVKNPNTKEDIVNSTFCGPLTSKLALAQMPLLETTNLHPNTTKYTVVMKGPSRINYLAVNCSLVGRSLMTHSGIVLKAYTAPSQDGRYSIEMYSQKGSKVKAPEDFKMDLFFTQPDAVVREPQASSLCIMQTSDNSPDRPLEKRTADGEAAATTATTAAAITTAAPPDAATAATTAAAITTAMPSTVTGTATPSTVTTSATSSTMVTTAATPTTVTSAVPPPAVTTAATPTTVTTAAPPTVTTTATSSTMVTTAATPTTVTTAVPLPAVTTAAMPTTVGTVAPNPQTTTVRMTAASTTHAPGNTTHAPGNATRASGNATHASGNVTTTEAPTQAQAKPQKKSCACCMRSCFLLLLFTILSRVDYF